MPYRRRAFRRSTRNFRSRRTSFRRRSFRPRRTTRTTRFSRNRSARRFSKHSKLSKFSVPSIFPDVAISKLIGHHVWTSVTCNDIATPLQRNNTTNNTFSIRLNANPNNGAFYYFPGATAGAPDQLNPYQTYASKYSSYRAMGAKVTVTIISQDDGQADPTTQVASPFMLVGFPAVITSGLAAGSSFSNQWDGSATPGYSATTIPQMKYGFRKISSGLGGRNMIKYSTYWDFPKMLGLTRGQYMSSLVSNLGPSVGNGPFVCSPDDNSADPTIGLFLVLALSDYTTLQTRECSVDIKITQYGRWEGQQADLF